VYDNGDYWVAIDAKTQRLAAGNPNPLLGILLPANGPYNASRYIDLNARVTGLQTAPALPASGKYLANPFWRDALVIISGGAVSDVGINGVSMGAISSTVLLQANAGIAVTYTAPPTWHWMTI
jgi:hypothetical protein